MQLGNVRIIHKCCGDQIPLATVNSKKLEELTEQLIKAIHESSDTLGIEGTLIAEEALQLAKGLKSGYGVTAGWNTPDTLAYQLMEYNLFEFSASKTEARLAAMTDLLIDKEKQTIRSFNEFRDLASQEVQEFNSNYLLSEYNLSVSVGQNSAAYHRFMAEKDDFPYVQYQTAGDNKVRNQHALLEGKIFNLNDKEAMNLWPPNGYGCRCEFLQTNQKPKETTTGTAGIELMQKADPKWKDSQFQINRGDLKQVFTNKQFYSDIKGLPEKMAKMTYQKYDLQAFELFKSDLNKVELDQSINEKNLKELFIETGKKGNKRFMGFEDYLGRKLVLTEATFDRHTKGNYLNSEERRHQLFPKVKDVLKKPDEVWLMKEGNEKTQYLKYVKYYQDMAIVVVNQIKNGQVEVKTWFQMKDEINTRTGILIKRKKD